MRYKNYSQKDAAIRSTNREQAKQAFAKGQSVKFSKEKSKMVRGIKYVPATKRLTVVFDNGDQYEYTGVSPKMALDMAVSNEPGAFYLEYIRGRIPSTQTVNQ